MSKNYLKLFFPASHQRPQYQNFYMPYGSQLQQGGSSQFQRVFHGSPYGSPAMQQNSGFHNIQMGINTRGQQQNTPSAYGNTQMNVLPCSYGETDSVIVQGTNTHVTRCNPFAGQHAETYRQLQQLQPGY